MRNAFARVLYMRPIREAEQAFEAMQKEREPAARWKALQGLGWEERLSAMGASLRQLAPVLAVRAEGVRPFQGCSSAGLGLACLYVEVPSFSSGRETPVSFAGRGIQP